MLSVKYDENKSVTYHLNLEIWKWMSKNDQLIVCQKVGIVRKEICRKTDEFLAEATGIYGHIE